MCEKFLLQSIFLYVRVRHTCVCVASVCEASECVCECGVEYKMWGDVKMPLHKCTRICKDFVQYRHPAKLHKIIAFQCVKKYAASIFVLFTRDVSVAAVEFMSNW